MPLPTIKRATTSATQTNLSDEPTQTLSEEDFTSQINTYVSEGSRNGYSADYVTQQIEALAKQNPDYAKKYGLSDYQFIKKSVEWGLHIEPTKEIQSRPMTAEDKKVIEKAGQTTMGLGLAAVGLASGAVLLPAIRALGVTTWESLMSLAGAPQGQQVVKDTIDCFGAMIDESPPPDTLKGFGCYVTDYVYGVGKKKESNE